MSVRASSAHDGGSVLGVDLGSENLRIAFSDAGVALSVPALLAQDARTGDVLAWGAGAHGLLGEVADHEPTPPDASQGMVIRRPLRNGGVADIACAAGLLRQAFFALGVNRRARGMPTIVASYTGAARDFEQRALLAACRAAGARRVELELAACAAIQGAGLQPGQHGASFVVGLGAGATDMSVMWNGDVVVQQSLRLGGDDLDTRIVRVLRREYSLAIGLITAESLKRQVGIAGNDDAARTIEVTGHDVCRGHPVAIAVPVRTLRRALFPLVEEIALAVRLVVETIPVALVNEVTDRGLILVGGGSRLRGFVRYLTEVTQLPVTVADGPETCVVRGLAGASRAIPHRRSIRAPSRPLPRLAV